MSCEANLGALMMKRLRVIGSTLRARPIGEKSQVMEALQRDIWPGFESGVIKPVIEAEFDIQEAAAAHALVAGNTTVGKVIMRVSDQ